MHASRTPFQLLRLSNAPAQGPIEAMVNRLIIGLGLRCSRVYRSVCSLGRNLPLVRLVSFGQQFSGSRPNWVLGPLYFLANASPADDWIGYSLLAVAVPCLLSVVVWPNRWTAMVSSLTAWAWVLPVTVKLLLAT